MSERKRNSNDFDSTVGALNGIFQEIPSDRLKDRMLCHLRKTPDAPNVLLTVTNIDKAYQAQLGIAEFKKHRVSLGIPDMAWKSFFTLFKSALESKQVQVDSSKENHVTLTFTYNLGEVQLESSFKLKRLPETQNEEADDDEDSDGSGYGSHEEEDSSKKKKKKPKKDSKKIVVATRTKELAHMMFDLLDKSRHIPDSPKPVYGADSDDLKAARLEIKALKTKLSAVEYELNSVRVANFAVPGSFPVGGIGLDEWANGLSQPDGSQSKAGKAKRKVKNASVLNPNQPRRKQRGAKIGDI